MTPWIFATVVSKDFAVVLPSSRKEFIIFRSGLQHFLKTALSNAAARFSE
jgi:hypothetical protein